MKRTVFAMLITVSLISGLCAAQDPSAMASMSDKERVDHLIKQNQILLESNARLASLAGRPKTPEEAFAVCMQAAKGTSAMSAESIGEHCAQILKRNACAPAQAK